VSVINYYDISHIGSGDDMEEEIRIKVLEVLKQKHRKEFGRSLGGGFSSKERFK
jgi:hypothetical protein